MIVTVRGTNGSGKSEAVRRFLASIGGLETLEPIYEDWRRKPVHYVSEKYNFVLLGHYEQQCGGADTLPFAQVRPRIVELHKGGWNVLFESMLYSVESKQLLIIREEVEDIRAIFIHATLDQCIKNIYSRRELTGKRQGTPLKEDRVAMNYRRVGLMRPKLEAVGIKCCTATVDQAARFMKKWLCNEGNGK